MPKVKYSRDKRSPVPKSDTVSRVMSANKAKNTGPEIKLRKELRKLGLSDYKLHYSKIPGKPDLVFKEKRLAIFVNGCFWHRCPFCKLTIPKTNAAFWRNKFKRNVVRDKTKISELKRAGWQTMVIWECKIKKNATSPAKKIASTYLH